MDALKDFLHTFAEIFSSPAILVPAVMYGFYAYGPKLGSFALGAAIWGAVDHVLIALLDKSPVMSYGKSLTNMAIERILTFVILAIAVYFIVKIIKRIK